MPGKTPQKSKVKGRGKPKGAKAVTGSSRAGTLFAPARCNRLLRRGFYARKNSGLAGVFMAGVLEFLTAELLEQAGDIASEKGKKRIVPSHLNLAIRSDAELKKLLCLTVIPESSVPRLIHEALLPKKKDTAAQQAS